MRAVTTSIALGIALFSAANAHANEPDTYGLGSRSSALAGAVTADARDFSATYYNPACLVAESREKGSSPSLSLSLGYSHIYNRLRINDADNHISDAHGISGGLVARGTVLGVPVAFGLGTFLPDDGLSRIKALRQETPRWALYDERATILFLSADLAISPLPWLSVGGGVAFLAATRGAFQIRGTANVLSPYDSQLEHEVNADLTSVRYPHLGLRAKVGDLGFVGLSYRGETKLKLSIDAHLGGIVDFSGIQVPLQYTLESRTLDEFLPQQIALGVSFRKVRDLTVNLDVVWVNWAAYESPTAQTKAHLAIVPPPGAPITLPGDPKPTVVVDPSFHNRIVPRIGIEGIVPLAGAPRRVQGRTDERRLLELALRAGYAFEASPVPDQIGITNFVDADRHIVTAGLGFALNAPTSILPGTLHLDFHSYAAMLPERTTHKDNPADFIGDYRASGSMLGLGAMLTTDF
jgi:long-chain fatty acid transport protein